MGTSCRWRLYFLLLLVVAGLSIGTVQTSRADRDIVFAAKEYRWSGLLYHDVDYFKPEQPWKPQCTVEKTGASHLYRINPDGTGRTQITFGLHDDYAPHFSPDGKQILFCRELDHEVDALCLMDANGGPVRILTQHAKTLVGKYDKPENAISSPIWSPDGRTIGYVLKSQFKSTLILIDTSGRVLRTIANVEEFNWSPDGRTLYLCGISLNRLLDLPTGKNTPAKARLYNPMWLDNREILGALNENDVSGPVVVMDKQGNIKRKLLDPGLDRRHWFRIGSGSPTCIVVGYSHNTGGYDPTSWLMDVHTGNREDLCKSDVVAVAPDGKRCAITYLQWTGPYKRGGKPLGALKIMNLATKKATPITSELMDISGGDWRRSR